MMRYLLLPLCFVLLSLIAKAQSDFDFTQRWFNESLYNPAAAGNSFTTGLFLHGRQQWLGFSKAPSTFAGAFDTYIENINSGIGITLANDRVGVTNTLNSRINYAYYIRTGKKSTLSFGLSAGLLVNSKRASEAAIENPNDPELSFGNATEYSPDFDFGLEFKGPLKFGFAIRHLGVKPSSNNYLKQTINYWAYLSSRFNITNSISLEPLLSATYRDNVLRAEFGTLFYFLKNESRDTYNDRFWLGGVFRTNNNFSLLAGIHITPKFRLGYSFDYGFDEITTLTKYGSHEIFLALQFNRIFYKDKLCPAYRKTSKYR